MVLRTLAKLRSYPDKILASFFFQLLPEILRLIILSICIVWKCYKLLTSNYRYMSIINKKSSKFVYRAESRPELDRCSICLSGFEAGDRGRELVDCNHCFHRHCLEKWLKGYQATCPLCRNVVVPEEIVAEYRMLQSEHENDGIEKELALVLLNALHNGICRRIF